MTALDRAILEGALGGLRRRIQAADERARKGTIEGIDKAGNPVPIVTGEAAIARRIRDALEALHYELVGDLR